MSIRVDEITIKVELSEHSVLFQNPKSNQSVTSNISSTSPRRVTKTNILIVQRWLTESI